MPTMALLLLLSACDEPKVETAPPDLQYGGTPPFERSNGVDDDHDGEVDEPVEADEADIHFVMVEVQNLRLPTSGVAVPELLPVAGYWGIHLLAHDALLAAPEWELGSDAYAVGHSGNFGDFGYTADLDGDGLGELFVGNVSTSADHEGGPRRTYAFRSDRLAGLSSAQYEDRDFECNGPLSGRNVGGMYEVGPLSGAGPIVACPYEDEGDDWLIPLYAASAFADGTASPEEADRTIRTDADVASLQPMPADLTGDGVPDLVVSVTDEDEDGGRSTRALIYDGGALTEGTYDASDADRTLAGAGTTRFSVGVTADDVTGDGVAELFFEQYSPAAEVCETLVVDLTLPDAPLPDAAFSRFALDVPSSCGGFTLLGDGDGDGRAEAAFGRGMDDAVRTFLVPGEVLGGEGRHGSSEGAVTFDPSTAGDDHEGSADLSGLWDLDGDGARDLLIVEDNDRSQDTESYGWLFLDAAAR